jgi:hypothetical protein
MARKTVAEVLRELEANLAFRIERARRDRDLEQREAMLREAEAPLRVALSAAGVHVESVWDLVNSPNDYDHALPILIAHLNREYPERIREGIARALAVPNSSTFFESLIRAFQAEQSK